jgi:uncharacterized membrane-anchored protein YhcB (DUF1043 family)
MRICNAHEAWSDCFFTPVFIVPGVVVDIFGLHLGNMHLKAQLSLEREMRCVPEVLESHSLMLL